MAVCRLVLLICLGLSQLSHSLQGPLAPLEWTAAQIGPAGPGLRWLAPVTAFNTSANNPFTFSQGGPQLLLYGGYRVPLTTFVHLNTEDYEISGQVWQFDIGRSTWTLVKDEPAPYLKRSWAAIASVNMSLSSANASATSTMALFVYGGQSYTNLVGYPGTYNDAWLFRCDTKQWTPVPTQGPRPPHLANYAYTTYKDRFMIIFGGTTCTGCHINNVTCVDVQGLTQAYCPPPYTGISVATNEMFILDMLEPQPQWYRLTPAFGGAASQPWPAPRSRAALTVLNHTLALFGGCRDTNVPIIADETGEFAPQVDDGVWTMDLSSLAIDPSGSQLQWTLASLPNAVSYNAPDANPFYNASEAYAVMDWGAVPLDDHRALLVGGQFTASVLSAAAPIFDVNTMTWSLTPTTLNQYLAVIRRQPSVTRIKNTVIVAGGYSYLSFFQDIHQFVPDAEVWSEVNQYVIPAPRVSPAAVKLQNKLWLMSGYDGRAPLPDLWAWDLSAMQWDLIQIVTDPVPRLNTVTVGLDNRYIVTFFGISAAQPVDLTVWVYDTNENKWMALYADEQRFGAPVVRSLLGGAVVPARNGATSTPVQGPSSMPLYLHDDFSIYFYGGLSYSGAFVGDNSTTSTVLLDMWALTFSRRDGLYWRPITTCQGSALCPGPVTFANLQLFVLNGEDVLVFHGGLTVNGPNRKLPIHIANSATESVLNETWVYWIQRDRWVKAKRAPGSEPQPTCFGHVMLPLSSDSFVLHGGSSVPPLPGDFGGIATLDTLNTTYVARLTTDNAGVTAGATGQDAPQVYVTWQLYSTLHAEGRSQHGAVMEGDTLVVVGGKTSEENIDLSPSLLKLACPSGTYGNFGGENGRCQPCPVGTYTTAPGRPTCDPCPAGLMTTAEGSMSLSQCSICRPNFCNGHGRCTVDVIQRTPECACELGWTGPHCDSNVGLTAGLIVFALIVVGLAAFAGRFYYRKHLKRLRLQAELTEHLLGQKQEELQELERAMQVHPDEVQLIRRIDGASPGAFGEVWEGRFSDMVVAVKRLQESVQYMDEQAKDDFVAEIKFMRTLRHKNIVYFYGCGVQNDQPFLLVEYMARGALRTVLADAKLDLSWALRLQFVRHAAAGMQFLHGLRPPRIHRDLKSPNLLVSDSWVVKVSDFGTSRLMQHLRNEDSSSVPSMRVGGTQESAADNPLITKGVGTLLWCAPEIHKGLAYSLPADVYSFAIVMWECATRRLPFADLKTSWAIRRAVEEGQRPEIPDNLPPMYGELMQRCWAPKPEDRPTFNEIVEQLAPIKLLNESSA